MKLTWTRGLSLVLVISLLLNISGILKNVDSVWFEFFSKWSGFKHDPTVVVVEINSWNSLNKDKISETLFAQLHQAELETLILNVPSEISSEWLKDWKKVSYRVLVLHEFNESRQRLVQVNPFVETTDWIDAAPSGISENPFIHSVWKSIGSRKIPTIAALASMEAHEVRRLPSTIKLNTANKQIPIQASFEDLVAKRLSNEILRGRTLIIGLSPHLLEGRFQIDERLDLDSSSQLLALAVSNLKKNTKVIDIPWWLELLTLALSIAFLIILYSRQSYGKSVALFLLISVLIVLISGLAWNTIHYWLFPSDLIIANALSALTTTSLLYWNRRDRQRMAMLDVTSNLRKKIIPEDVVGSVRYWENVFKMITQVLDLPEMAFFEFNSTDRNLSCSLYHGYESDRISKFSQSLNPSTIKEFSKTSEPKIFNPNRENDLEKVYIVNLTYAGFPQGFWVFSVPPNISEDEKEDFWVVVRSFTSELAKLIYLKRESEKSKTTKHSLLRKIFRPNVEEDDFRNIYESFQTLESQSRLNEAVFDKLQTATVLYDLFGRLMQVNLQSKAILGELNISAHSTNALELATLLTGETKSSIRDLLRKVLFQGESVFLPLIQRKNQNNLEVLHIAVIQNQNSSSSKPFGAAGILFEIIDISHLKKLFQLKDSFFRHANVHLRQDIEAVMLASEFLEGSAFSQSEDQDSREMVELISSKSLIMTSTIRKLDQYLERDVFRRPVVFPIKAELPLKDVLQKNQKTIDSRSIEVEEDYPAVPELIISDYYIVSELIELIFEILLQDVPDNGKIGFKIAEESDHLVFHLKSQGYGLTDELLKRLLAEEQNSNPLFNSLRLMIPKLKEINCEISILSKTGEGLEFVIKFNRF